ncbi:bifunctional glyoxylate/hydroxypyruvate reductase B [Salipaludibacillus neizhouensis]|uniref:Bifunctional glyoxylate/hydroxypyruvate reductase B n=1 Tax=Salipaludibacillus neizhouensis TaxID=885475 RepID=A0A3A9K286_9BACI|nr:D-glycerate dehydrogenase [Salipaludibacillus neizhouensis]RKL65040.1 bifunctional glyoxylate/hydroxypyruvate reductase B [Salipaludibacillus neizhouensis]
MKPKVILYNRLPEDLLEKLEKNCDVRQYNLESSSNPDFLQDLQEAEGIIGSGLKVNGELLDQTPKLKIVTNISVGYNNLDIEELTKRNIMATNTPDVLTDTTADTVFGLLLSTARRIPELDHYVKSGQWQQNITQDLFGVDVHHKKLGIIGMGRIGYAIAERAHFGFKMNILYNNRSRNISSENELNAEFTSLDELLVNSDFVCLMAPLVPETVNLIGKREFRLMKKSAIFINGSRGALVNEDELIYALTNREILAAGLDVYKEEPLNLESPLRNLKNVVTLPHIGSATEETRYKMAHLAVENLIKGLQKETPPSLLNTEVLKLWETNGL